MKIETYNIKGEKAVTAELPEGIFGVAWKPALVKQVFDGEMANKRRPWAHTKTRGEVRGGGRKPWLQKGTGRARHGSRRSPLWSGGGVTFGPRNERNFSLKINKKQKQKALFAVLTSKVQGGKFVMMDTLSIPEPKTKAIIGVLHAMAKVIPTMETKKTLIITPSANKNIMLSARNIQNASVIAASSLNVYDLLAHANVMMMKDSIAVMQQTYTRTVKGAARNVSGEKAEVPVRATTKKKKARKAAKKGAKKTIKK